MVEYAEASFKLNSRQKDGSTRREHYIAAGIPESDWGLPDFPILLFDLWEWFLLLHADRCGGTGGPITHVSMDAFCRLRGVRLSKWEMDAVLKLDSIALEHFKDS